MEEKNLVEGCFKKDFRSYVLLVISIVLFLIGITINCIDYFDSSWLRSEYGSLLEFTLETFPEAGNSSHIGKFFFYVAIPLLIIGIIVLLMTSRCSIKVSNTRVIGKASFGKQVDLPINQVSAIGLGALNSISISTSAGHMRFWLLTNRTEVYDTLSKLLAASNEKRAFESANATTVIQQNSDEADKLKKYKDLLDSGVITQEEFDAKKKQLLGL